MREIAENVWHIPLMPRDGMNAYVLGDVLVDAGLAGHGKKLPGKLGGHTITAHTLTHAHPDHVGGSKHLVDALGVPFWAPAGDVFEWFPATVIDNDFAYFDYALVSAPESVHRQLAAKPFLEVVAGAGQPWRLYRISIAVG